MKFATGGVGVGVGIFNFCLYEGNSCFRELQLACVFYASHVWLACLACLSLCLACLAWLARLPCCLAALLARMLYELMSVSSLLQCHTLSAHKI